MKCIYSLNIFIFHVVCSPLFFNIFIFIYVNYSLKSNIKLETYSEFSNYMYVHTGLFRIKYDLDSRFKESIKSKRTVPSFIFMPIYYAIKIIIFVTVP